MNDTVQKAAGEIGEASLILILNYLKEYNNGMATNISEKGFNTICEHLEQCNSSAIQSCIDEANAWQPIETAPKDGTSILVYGKRRNEEKWWVEKASWSSTHKMFMAGYATTVGQDFLTHWRHLPTPPNVNKEE